MALTTQSCLSCTLNVSDDSCTPSLLTSSFFVLCGIVTTISNIINLLALKFTKQCFSENTRISFQVVAIVDFSVGLFCCTFHSIRFSGIPITTLRSFDIIGVSVCSTLFNQSVMILSCISIDRYIAVTRPLRYNAIMTHGRMKLLLVSGILIGTITSSSSLLHKALTGIDDVIFASADIASNPIHIVYFIPIVTSAIVTAFCNIAMMRVARRHRRLIATQVIRKHPHQEPNQSMSDETVSYRNKDVRTVLAVTGAFYITWGAAVSSSIVSALTGIRIPCIARNLILVLTISNSFWNVLIYLLMKPLFRRTVSEMLRRWRR
ncbi:probable G-protein coupled receptor 21 [Lytechinus variegatus]|uniref:probable G-protein coupled receptor 21 n=1 Tax=Lytechinus variegatus TaxID=7654 RepID=UPI001BB1E9EB|nr:probable G-protein coupled receptor 21 [Lytechinus variegatus]